MDSLTNGHLEGEGPSWFHSTQEVYLRNGNAWDPPISSLSFTLSSTRTNHPTPSDIQKTFRCSVLKTSLAACRAFQWLTGLLYMKGDPSSQHYEITNQDESQSLQGQISNSRGQVAMLSNAVLCGSSSLQLCLSACVRFPRVLTCSLSALGNCKQCFLKHCTISNHFLCSRLWKWYVRLL